MVMSVGFDNLKYLCPTLGDRSHHQSLTHSKQTTSSAPVFSKTKVWLDFNKLNNVSSNVFQNMSSGLADDTAKNLKWRRWG
jgi:hypothetical protein